MSLSETASAMDDSSEKSSITGGGAQEEGGVSNGLEEGLFGILFTVSREKIDDSKKAVIFQVLVDTFQLLAFVLNPDGWQGSSTVSFLWKYAGVFHSPQIVTTGGYTMYIILFCILSAILVASVCVCAFLGWSFKNKTFPFVWPIKFVRYAIALFISTFYISTLNFLLLALDCTYSGRSSSFLDAWPERSCWGMPHLPLSILSMLFLLVFIGFGACVALVSAESDVSSKYLLAASNSSVEFHLFIMRTTLAVFDVLLSRYQLLNNILVFAFSFLVAVDIAVLAPYYHASMNGLRSGLFAVVSWAALCRIMVEIDILTIQTVVVMMFSVMPVVFIATWSITSLRIRYCWPVRWLVLNEGESSADLDYEFSRVIPRESDYEIAARIGLTFPKDSPQEIVHQYSLMSQAILLRGMEIFPHSVFLHLAMSNYVITLDGNHQLGQFYLDKARRMESQMHERFQIFVRAQERKHRISSSSAGESVMDLVSFVEFQSSSETAQKSYRSLQKAIRRFWRMLMRDGNGVPELSKAFHAIDKYEQRTEAAYRSLLEKYPKSIKLLKSFSKFLTNIKFDPWSAQKFLSEVERLEEAAEENRRRARRTGFADGEFAAASLVDSEADALIVAGQNGIMQNVNKLAAQAFGYQQDEMLGRNLSMLMPSPLSHQHDGFLQAYLKTGKSKILGKVRRFEALHKDGHLFPIQIAANRVDTVKGVTFVAVIKLLREEDVATVTTDSKGIITAFNKPFCDLFEFLPADLKGKSINTTIIPLKYADVHDRFIEEYLKTGIAKVVGTAGRRLLARKKDGSEMPVLLSLTESGTGNDKKFKAELAEASEEIGSVVCSASGTILSANKYIAQIFAMPDVSWCIGKNVSCLCPSPFAEHHNKYLQRYLGGGKSTILGRGRIVPAKAVDGSQFFINLAVSDVIDSKTGERTFAARIKQVDNIERTCEILVSENNIIVDYCFPDAQFDILGIGISKHCHGDNIETVISDFAADGLIDCAAQTYPIPTNVIIPNTNQNILCSVQVDEWDGTTSPNSILTNPNEEGAYLISMVDLSFLDIVIIVDKTGEIKSASPESYYLFGIKPSALIRQSIQNVLAKETSQKILDLIGEAKSKSHGHPQSKLIPRIKGVALHKAGICLKILADATYKKLDESSQVHLRLQCTGVKHSNGKFSMQGNIKDSDADFESNSDMSELSDSLDESEITESDGSLSSQSRVSLGMPSDKKVATTKFLQKEGQNSSLPKAETGGFEDDLKREQLRGRDQRLNPKDDGAPQRTLDLSSLAKPVLDVKDIDNKAEDENETMEDDTSSIGEFSDNGNQESNSDQGSVSISGASAEIGEDFVKARKVRKLQRLFGAARVKQSTEALRMRMKIVMVLLAAANVVAFIISTVEYANFFNDLKRPGDAGLAAAYLEGGAVTVHQLAYAQYVDGNDLATKLQTSTAFLTDMLNSLYESSTLHFPIRSSGKSFFGLNDDSKLGFLTINRTFTANLQDALPGVSALSLPQPSASLLQEKVGLWTAVRESIFAMRNLIPFSSPAARLELKTNKHFLFIDSNVHRFIRPSFLDAAKIELDQWIQAVTTVQVMTGSIFGSQVILLCAIAMFTIIPILKKVVQSRASVFEVFYKVHPSIVWKLSTQAIESDHDLGDSKEGGSSSTHNPSNEDQYSSDSDESDGMSESVGTETVPPLQMQASFAKRAVTKVLAVTRMNGGSEKKAKSRKSSSSKKSNRNHLTESSSSQSNRFVIPFTVIIFLAYLSTFVATIIGKQQAISPAQDVYKSRRLAALMFDVYFESIQLRTYCESSDMTSLSGQTLELQQSVSELNEAYSELMLGVEGAAGALSRWGGTQSELLFGSNCMSDDPSVCEAAGADSARILSGLDTLIRAFSESAEYVASRASQSITCSALNSELGIGFMDKVLWDHLLPGIRKSTQLFLSEAQRGSNTSIAVSSTVFALVLCVLPFTYKGYIEPFTLTIENESSRAATLLAQLPAIVNVHDLVTTSMKDTKAVSKAASRAPTASITKLNGLVRALRTSKLGSLLSPQPSEIVTELKPGETSMDPIAPPSK